MFARAVAGCLPLLLLAACASGDLVAEQSGGARVEGSSALARPDMRAECAGKEDWTDPGPPVPIFANVYHVGTCAITVLLVTSPAGHILLDASPAASIPSVIDNIHALGFEPEDVEWIVSSHEHWDHAGGLAALKQATGARLAANAAAVEALRTGRPYPEDPQASWLEPSAPVEVDRIMRDGEILTIGSLALTMHATPAHAPGSTSWTWTSCDGDTCHRIAYADSVSAPAPETYRFTDHPDQVARFRDGLVKIAALSCDLLLTPHPGQSDMYARYAGKTALVDPQACVRYAKGGEQAMDARLASEARQ